MALSVSGLLGGSGLELGILLGDSSLNLLLLILLEPVHFLLTGLLEEDVLLSRLIDVLQEVDSGLLFSLPLGLSHFVLSLSFLLHELVNKLFVGCFIGFRLLVVLLKLDDFLAALSSLSFLNVLQGLLFCKGSLQKLLISCLLSVGLDTSKFPLGSIVIDELKVPFSVKNELLSLCLLVCLDFLSPLLLKHLLLSGFFLSIDLFCLSNCILLPCENVKSLLNLLFLCCSLILLSLDFLLMIEHPQLGVDLLLNDRLFELGFLVHELLFSLELGSGNHESGLLLSQVVGLHFEFPLEGVLHELGPLLFALLLQGVQSIGHLGSDLLGSFEGRHKFLLINFVLGG